MRRWQSRECTEDGGWQWAGTDGPDNQRCIHPDGTTFTADANADEVACQQVVVGYQWQGGKGSSGAIVLRTGSATKGVGGSLSLAVGSGGFANAGRIGIQAGESTSRTGGSFSLVSG